VSELFGSGRIVDLIVVLMLLEGIALFVYRRRTGRGIATLDWVWNLLAGYFLLLALRAALVHADWRWIALSLALALAAHLGDLWRRSRV
jgi:hypothetical protein